MPTACLTSERPCPGASPLLRVTRCRAAPLSQRPSHHPLTSFQTTCLRNRRNVLPFSFPKFHSLFMSIMVLDTCSAYLILSAPDWKSNHELGLASLRNSCCLSHSYVIALKLCLVVCSAGFYPFKTGGPAEQR